VRRSPFRDQAPNQDGRYLALFSHDAGMCAGVWVPNNCRHEEASRGSNSSTLRARTVRLRSPPKVT
jgi:hypothetical protein